mmetsp:Transcript_1860/g.5448  ORF Transcript_1860/g.5448 Transcript_1860/m.5448 type:complete len:223 (-) Transcript_1860:459-1127(-)
MPMPYCVISTQSPARLTAAANATARNGVRLSLWASSPAWATMVSSTAGAARARMRRYCTAGPHSSAAHPVMRIMASAFHCNRPSTARPKARPRANAAVRAREARSPSFACSPSATALTVATESALNRYPRPKMREHGARAASSNVPANWPTITLSTSDMRGSASGIAMAGAVNTMICTSCCLRHAHDEGGWSAGGSGISSARGSKSADTSTLSAAAAFAMGR